MKFKINSLAILNRTYKTRKDRNYCYIVRMVGEVNKIVTVEILKKIFDLGPLRMQFGAGYKIVTLGIHLHPIPGELAKVLYS